MNVPPRGTIARAGLELAVRWRQLGRAVWAELEPILERVLDALARSRAKW